MKIKTMQACYILLLIILPFAIKVRGQACGGGKLTLNIYTLNGNIVKEFSYEILPVSTKILHDDFEKEMKVNNILVDLRNTGTMISKNQAEKMIEPGNDSLNKSLQQYLNRSVKGSQPVAASGKVRGTLQLNTVELAYFPVILKISDGEKTAWLLGNYLGGCDREISLVWEKKILL